MKERLQRLIVEGWERPAVRLAPRAVTLPLAGGKIIAVTGPRRCGKTSLLALTRDRLLAQGVPVRRIVTVSFDDPGLLPFAGRQLELLVEAWRELEPAPSRAPVYFFLDEIQNVAGWEAGVRRLHDLGRFRLFLTGSSSRLLGREIATQLRGRALNYELLPFSFGEILAARGVTVSRDLPHSEGRFAVRRLLDEYLAYGGFPEVVLEKNRELKFRILREYVETMFFRDLVERYRIRNRELLRELMRHLVTYIANPFSVSAFYRGVKQRSPVTKRTLLAYVAALEDSGLIRLQRKFSLSLKERNHAPRKNYLVDLGLRLPYGFKCGAEVGKCLENAVAVELEQRRLLDPQTTIYYWRDVHQREVDFAMVRGGRVRELIQACADPLEPAVRERELAALLGAGRALRCRRLLVITRDHEADEVVKRSRIRFIPLWRWLLNGGE